MRGLNRQYVDEIRAHAADATFEQARELMEAGELSEVVNGDQRVGWVTPDQTLWIPAPKGHARSKQVMVLGLDYLMSAAMFAAATDRATLDLVEALLDLPSGVELFSKGQCFYKEGVAHATDAGGVRTPSTIAPASGKPGGNPKFMHQDSAYFMFGGAGRGDAQLHLRHRSDARQWPALRYPRVAPLRAHRASTRRRTRPASGGA